MSSRAMPEVRKANHFHFIAKPSVASKMGASYRIYGWQPAEHSEHRFFVLS